MSGTLLLIRCLLAAVFAVAGTAKLLDRAGARQSLREFGVPKALAMPVAIVLPGTELACTLMLLAGATAWWGALVSLLLLTLFIAAIVVNLARGRTPDCHCFGRLHSEPVGWSTVGRNVVLASLAAWVVAQGSEATGPGLIAWIGSLSGVETTLLALTAGLVALAAVVGTMLVQLLAQNGRLMLRVEALEGKLGSRVDAAPQEPGLAVSTAAPSFSLTGLDGIPVSLDALRTFDKPLLLVFTEPGCSACDALLPSVARWQREHAGRLLIVPIGRGDLQANQAKAVEHGLQHILVQQQREVAEAYLVQESPSAVLVKDGLVASPLAAGADAIRDLVFRQTLPASVKHGDRAPTLELPDVDGQVTNVAQTNGRRRVLLFWNPSCGFCKAMLRDLKSWERTRARTAPELLVISAGSSESNREQGFRSRVLLDPIFGAGRVFGASGTPSAVALDEQGRVASEVGVGAPAVLAMLGVTQDSAVAV